MTIPSPPKEIPPNEPKELPPDQVTKRVNHLFFEPQINPKTKYQKLFQIFGLMLLTMIFSVFVKMEYFILPTTVPVLAIVYLVVFVLQIQIIKITQFEVKIFLIVNLLFFMVKSSFDMVYSRYGIIQTDSIILANIEYTLFTFVMGYIFVLLVRFRFKAKFLYVLIIYHIIFVFTFDLYLNSYFTNPNVQYLLILGYWVGMELLYYVFLYRLLKK